jgi:quercetin 2,3-dioxygenase
MAPSYEQESFDDASKRGQLRLVASPDGRDGSVTLHADASIRARLFDGDESAQLAIESGRLAYVQVVRGAIDVNGLRLATGDAAKLSNETVLNLTHGEKAEVLVFDLAT